MNSRMDLGKLTSPTGFGLSMLVVLAIIVS
jgi:hypothetical protein